MSKSYFKPSFVFAAVIIVFANLSVTVGQPDTVSISASTRCLIETRSGKKSCWGIVINFEEAKFKKRIAPEHLKVLEAKHGHNLTSLMTWHISHDRKRLTIKFKFGAGDFGTGNNAEITLYKAAFAVPPKSLSDSVIFVQKTDIN